MIRLEETWKHMIAPRSSVRVTPSEHTEMPHVTFRLVRAAGTVAR